MLLVLGCVRLPADGLDQARPVMARMIAASRAEAGCREYAYAQDVLDPTLIRISELWDGQSALDAHFASPHISEWRASWSDLGIHGRDLMVYEVGEPAAV